MQILRDICLKPFTTLGVRVRASELITVNSIAVLADLKQTGRLDNRKVMVLGEGSNVLFSENYEGLVLLNQIFGYEVIEESEGQVLLKVGGGENWSRLVDYCVSKNWGGIENLSLIPGTAGAAPVQNIGAYGAELKDVFVSLSAFDLRTGDIEIFDSKSCEFAYRNSIFKSKFPDRYFIYEVTLRLQKEPDFNLEYAPLQEEFAGRNPENISILEISNAVKKIRRSKLPDPAKIGNAGSFFKNPSVSESKMNELKAAYPGIPVYINSDGSFKLAAGWLIEQSGWKGKRMGDAGVHDKQALVLVNYGEATGQELLKFANQIEESIWGKFGIKLEKEVRVI